MGCDITMDLELTRWQARQQQEADDNSTVAEAIRYSDHFVRDQCRRQLTGNLSQEHAPEDSGVDMEDDI